MLTWKREERALNRWWFGAARWSVAIKAAMGSVGLPGLDSGGGGDEGWRELVGFEEEEEAVRFWVVAAAIGC